MKMVIGIHKNISILEGLKVEFNRLRFYSNNGTGRCQWYTGTCYSSIQGKV